ncbi:nucleotide-diphospho-sugar transferase [Fimicolochytrium jonesii]|uniref:nucleotide-diphospho-sugar transferase n=1 Tax=Fimicolochytrium jonesii TaxID=1396493 RepID=UPI0022FF119E|nr:nucleotide-diphospho-sugar transferase [Fimicolochytrium jonesii]KAI8822473.1 nucleotide-diphospho-sugar transferase [Fimicolochytrium jonesii]
MTASDRFRDGVIDTSCNITTKRTLSGHQADTKATHSHIHIGMAGRRLFLLLSALFFGGIITTLIGSTYYGTSELPHSRASRAPRPETGPRNERVLAQTSAETRRLAYVFYVTNDQYACASLVLADSIVKAGKRPDIPFTALYTDEVSESYRNRLLGSGMKIQRVQTVRTSTGDPTWATSMTRNIVFNMTEYDRIIVLDSDALVITSLDSLFDLPSYPLYAARAYWIKQPFFQSTLYVIEPSTALYEKQEKVFLEASAKGETLFDMDVANRAFGDMIGLLPGTIATLNGDFKAPKTGPSAANPLITVDQAAKSPKYVHFSESPGGGYGKPWGRGRSVSTNPDSHPLFEELFHKFWAGQDKLCG